MPSIDYPATRFFDFFLKFLSTRVVGPTTRVS